MFEGCYPGTVTRHEELLRRNLTQKPFLSFETSDIFQPKMSLDAV